VENSDELVSKVELRYGLRAIESEAKGLFYLQDDERKLIGILTLKNGRKSCAILSKKQAYALIDEFKAVCDLYWEE
jgi:hypothetical protein